MPPALQPNPPVPQGGGARDESPSPTVLVVDDDPSVRSAVGDFLETEGFHVLTAAGGSEMWTALRDHAVAVVLLDVMLPGESGLDLAQALADRDDIGVIMVSALGSETDRVAGLEIGADDYLAKPIAPRELVARMRALLRRCRRTGARSDREHELAGWRLDVPRRVLKNARGVITRLTEREFAILLALAQHRGAIVSSGDLIRLAPGLKSCTGSLGEFVERLRDKLRSGGGGELIQAAGDGYRLTTGLVEGGASSDRSGIPAGTEACAAITVDAKACFASVGGYVLDLTYSECALLAVLVEANGTVVSKNDLSLQALGRPWRSFDRSIDVHVSNLRGKLGDYPAIVISAVRKVGYRLTVNDGASHLE